jgi:hypothetical protein
MDSDKVCRVIIKRHRVVEVWAKYFYQYYALGLIRVSRSNPFLGRLPKGLKARPAGKDRKELEFMVDGNTAVGPRIGNIWRRIRETLLPSMANDEIRFYRFENHDGVGGTEITDDSEVMREYNRAGVYKEFLNSLFAADQGGEQCES